MNDTGDRSSVVRCNSCILPFPLEAFLGPSPAMFGNLSFLKDEISNRKRKRDNEPAAAEEKKVRTLDLFALALVARLALSFPAPLKL